MYNRLLYSVLRKWDFDQWNLRKTDSEKWAHFVSLFKRETKQNLSETLVITLLSLTCPGFLPPETQIDFRQLHLDSEVFEICFEMKVGLFLKIRKVYSNTFQEGFATAKAAALQFSLCIFVFTNPSCSHIIL